MALLKSFIGIISGKIGGNVFSHGRSGQVMKALSIPVNPNSQAQQIARSQIAHLSVQWFEDLTDAQRETWETYAANVPVKNRLGDTIFLTGQNHFVRSNSIGQRNDLPLILDGPTNFNVGDFHHVSIATTVSGTMQVTWDDTHDWADEDDSIMIVQQARPVNSTKDFFKGPFVQLGTILGNLAIPPTSPTDLTGGFLFASGQKMFARVRVLRADGRLSAPQIVSTIAAIV